jgi:hypothetical protein
MQQFIHYFLHLVFPVFIAIAFYKRIWLKAYFIFLLTMLVDMDHLLATPVFDAARCGVGFHPLHSYLAILIYIGLLLFPKMRLIAVGLLLHMTTDFIDCLFNYYLI